jgi:hypothetical protein
MWKKFETEIRQVCEERKELAIHPIWSFLLEKGLENDDTTTLENMLKICTEYYVDMENSKDEKFKSLKFAENDVPDYARIFDSFIGIDTDFGSEFYK